MDDFAATTEREPKASALDRCLRRRRFRCLPGSSSLASSRSISPMRFARSRASSVVRSWVCVWSTRRRSCSTSQLLAIVRGLSVLLACHDGSLNVAVDCRSGRESVGGQPPHARIFAERIALVAHFPVKVIRAERRRNTDAAVTKEDWRKDQNFWERWDQRTLTPSAVKPAMIVSTPAMR